MTNESKQKVKRSSAFVGGLICLLLAVGFGVHAFSSSDKVTPTTVFENANNVTINNPAQPVVEEPALGASSAAGTQESMVCHAGDCIWSAAIPFTDSTTTIFAIKNPFYAATTTAEDVILDQQTTGFGFTGATSTVEMIRLNITAVATTTYRLACSSAITYYATSTASIPLLVSSEIATSTGVGMIENNLTAANSGGITGGSVPKIALTPTQPYFLCKVFNASGNTTYDGAFTDIGHTFD